MTAAANAPDLGWTGAEYLRGVMFNFLDLVGTGVSSNKLDVLLFADDKEWMDAVEEAGLLVTWTWMGVGSVADLTMVRAAG